ncbi:hypothetical protein AACH10_03560 [Ideonella sp. DXS22W]|uniref:OmpA-like domain-containing protein n=1 Tax=Pseudaquabacterium inlustre TaxID=2984192 RepID=A0ABU9CC26_9BURK
MAGGGSSGVNAYWPGFVDALTNVVIAMIFVVVALAISLTFAAQLMGKKLAERLMQEQAARVAASAPAAPPPPGDQAADGDASAVAGRTLIAVKGNERAAGTVAARVRTGQNLLQLTYAPGALTLDDEAAQRLRAALQPPAGGAGQRSVEVVASGPQMSSSDNQRAAYVRVMAVRNQLLELGYAAERIQVRIDTQRDAAEPQVRLVIKE